MLEFVCIADVHLHPHRQCSNNSGIDRIDDGLLAIRNSLDVARHHNCPWVFLGDLKHIKGIWHQYALNQVLFLLQEFGDVGKLMVHGNHDGIAGGSGLFPFKTVKNTKVVFKPEMVEFPGTGRVAVWPHQKDTSELAGFVEAAMKTQTKILFGHIFLSNSVVGPTDRPLVKGTTLTELGVGCPFEWAFLGDVHKAQVVPGSKEGGWAVYPGSPVALNWGENELDKGFLYVNLNKETKQIQPLPVLAPKFRTVDWSGLSVEEARGEVDKGTHKNWKGDFVKLIAPPAVDPNIIQRVMERSQARWFSVTLRKKEKNPEARTDMHAGMTQEQLLKEYMKTRPPDSTVIKSTGSMVFKAGLRLLEEKE